MNREEFTQLFGLGVVSVLAAACLGGCSAATGSDSTLVAVATGDDINLDLVALGFAMP